MTTNTQPQTQQSGGDELGYEVAETLLPLVSYTVTTTDKTLAVIEPKALIDTFEKLIQAREREVEKRAELYGRLHQVVEMFQQGILSAKDYSFLHESITNRISELAQPKPQAGGGSEV